MEGVYAVYQLSKGRKDTPWCVCVCLHFGGWSRFSGLLHGREPSSFILTHCLLLFPRLFIQCQRHHGPIADIGHENMETLHLMSQSMASVGV